MCISLSPSLNLSLSLSLSAGVHSGNSRLKYNPPVRLDRVTTPPQPHGVAISGKYRSEKKNCTHLHKQIRKQNYAKGVSSTLDKDTHIQGEGCMAIQDPDFATADATQSTDASRRVPAKHVLVTRAKLQERAANGASSIVAILQA